MVRTGANAYVKYGFEDAYGAGASGWRSLDRTCAMPASLHPLSGYRATGSTRRFHFDLNQFDQLSLSARRSSKIAKPKTQGEHGLRW